MAVARLITAALVGRLVAGARRYSLLLTGRSRGEQLMESLQIGQRGPVVRNELQGELVVVLRLAPAAFYVQQGAEIAVNSHVLVSNSARIQLSISKLHSARNMTYLRPKLDGLSIEQLGSIEFVRFSQRRGRVEHRLEVGRRQVSGPDERLGRLASSRRVQQKLTCTRDVDSMNS